MYSWRISSAGTVRFPYIYVNSNMIIEEDNTRFESIQLLVKTIILDFTHIA